jgi:enoyl-CoA hydratase
MQRASTRLLLAREVAVQAGVCASTPAVEQTVAMLLECGPEVLREQKALLRQWEELPLKESDDISIDVFGRCCLTGEPQRLMQDFVNRKRRVAEFIARSACRAR